MNILNDMILLCAKDHATTEEVSSLWKMGKCANVCALQDTQAYRALPELKLLFVFFHWLKIIICANFKMVNFLR